MNDAPDTAQAERTAQAAQRGPNANARKLKLLHLLRILWTRTDAQRGLSLPEIIAALHDLGIEAERKSIYRDFDALRAFGLDIRTRRTRPVEYYLRKGELGLNEIMLLVDAAQESKFLTEWKSRQLIGACKALVSEREASLLDRRVHVQGRIRSQSDSVFRNVDLIHRALAEKRAISFQYCKYGTDLERHPTNDGAPYLATPVKVAFVDGSYYLAAWMESAQAIRTFRIDRMQLLAMTDEPAVRNKEIAAYRAEHFEHQAFGMFHGTPTRVTLHVQAKGMDVIVDRFGHDVKVTHATPEECDVHVDVVVSRLFHGWLAAMDDIMELVAPASAVEEHRTWLRERAAR